MAPEANILINIEGKPFMLSKHVKRSSLIGIIGKLQEDLIKIKEYTTSEDNYRTELDKVKLECIKLKEILSKENYTESEDEILSDVGEFQEQTEIRTRLKENYEKKAFNTMQLYDEKIDMLRKQIVEIDKDREAFVEIIEKKQSTIKGLKRDTLRLKKEKQELEQHHNEVITELRQKNDDEREQMERENQTLVAEKEVLNTTYIDLDKIRKYLENNNAALKSSLSETNRINEDRIRKLSTDNEEQEAKHLEEINRMRQSVEAVVHEAELKIESIEETLAKSNEEHRDKLNEAKQESDRFKALIRNFEQQEQSLKDELSICRNLVEQTRCFYENSIRALNKKFDTEKDKIDTEMVTLKSRYENKLNEMKNGKEEIEGDTNVKVKQINQLQSEKNFMADKIAKLRSKSEENNRKYLENYNHLKDYVEMIKSNYETEKVDLKNQLDGKDKLFDDLELEKKKLEKQVKSLMYTNELLKQENEKDLDTIGLKIQNQKESYNEELQKLKENQTKKVKLIENDLQQAKLDYDVLDTNYNELLANKQNLDKSCQSLRQQVSEIEHEHRKELHQIKESYLKNERTFEEDLQKKNREIQKHKKLAQTLENEVKDLKSQNGEHERTIQLLEANNKEEIERLEMLTEENSNFYKDDMQNMKQLLSYKEEVIRKLEEKLNSQEINHTLAINEKQDEMKSIEENNDAHINELKTNYELQTQKYDILIYGFYRELENQQSEKDELEKLKSELEQENINLKKRNSDIIMNLKKQQGKYQNDSEFMKLLEFLLT